MRKKLSQPSENTATKPGSFEVRKATGQTGQRASTYVVVSPSKGPDSFTIRDLKRAIESTVGVHGTKR